MIGRQDQEQTVTICFTDFQRCQGNGRRRVATLRLENDALPILIDLPRLFSYQKPVLLVADDNRSPFGSLACPPESALQKRLVTEQGMKLLREELSRKRP